MTYTLIFLGAVYVIVFIMAVIGIDIYKNNQKKKVKVETIYEQDGLICVDLYCEYDGWVTKDLFDIVFKVHCVKHGVYRGKKGMMFVGLMQTSDTEEDDKEKVVLGFQPTLEPEKKG